jgi:hypothetical protein
MVCQQKMLSYKKWGCLLQEKLHHNCLISSRKVQGGVG